MNPPFFVLLNNANQNANENREYYRRDVPRPTLYLEKHFEGGDRVILSLSTVPRTVFGPEKCICWLATNKLITGQLLAVCRQLSKLLFYTKHGGFFFSKIKINISLQNSGEMVNLKQLKTKIKE